MSAGMGNVSTNTKDQNPSSGKVENTGNLNAGSLLPLIMKWIENNPKKAKALGLVGGSVVSSILGDPKDERSKEQKEAEKSQSELLKQQEEAGRILAGIIAAVTSGDPGKGPKKAPQFHLGQPYDWSKVRGMGDINLLLKRLGIGSPTGAITAGSNLASVERQAAGDSVAKTVEGLMKILFGFGDDDEVIK